MQGLSRKGEQASEDEPGLGGMRGGSEDACCRPSAWQGIQHCGKPPRGRKKLASGSGGKNECTVDDAESDHERPPRPEVYVLSKIRLKKASEGGAGFLLLCPTKHS